MKKLICIIFLIAGSRLSVSAQSNGPDQLTPQLLQTIKANVEKLVPAFRKKHADVSPATLEFMIDTFRIGHVYRKASTIDYSTAGINEATDTRAEGYDKLLNKYYNRLLKLLKPEDKKALIDAQRSWLAFRNNESKLIDTLSKEVYSGGGTLQSIATASQFADLTVKRALQIADYYVYIMDMK